MKKIVLFLVICMILTGCGNAIQQSKSQISSSESPVVNKGTLCADLEESPKLSSSTEPESFKNKDELIEKVKNVKNEDGDNSNQIKELKYFFEPMTAPPDMTLEVINVKGFYCGLTYSNKSKSSDEFSTFDIVWYRTMTDKDIQIALNSYSDVSKTYEEYKNNGIHYYMQTVSNPILNEDGSIDTESSPVDVCQMIFWSQYGYVFQANAPLWFTKDDISRYCVAQKVKIDE